jgi:cytochrome c-type biogenesis protein CcmE
MDRLTRTLGIAVLLVLLVVPAAFAQQLLTVPVLLQHSDEYDGKVVSVTGAITSYRERVSARGNAYTTFRVEDGGASVSVFAWEHQGLHDGQRVRVTGTFDKVKRVGRYTFYNEIQAQGIEKL